jgi:hypothetical protein
MAVNGLLKPLRSSSIISILKRFIYSLQVQLPGTKVQKISSDILTMINPVSIDSSLISMATNMQGSSAQMQISVAIMNQIQDQQKAFADALLNMINTGPMPDGTGQVINIGA